MYYYQHHIGDYLKDTAQLSLLEHGVYLRLIQNYYATETHLPDDLQKICRSIGARSQEEIDAVKNCLSDFFSLGDSGWVMPRCDSEIAEFHGKSEKAKRSASQRWENEKRTHGEGSAKPMRTHSEGNANQEPITNNQEPIENQDQNLLADKSADVPENVPGKAKTRKPESMPEGFDEFWLSYPNKVAKPVAVKAWQKIRPDQQTQQKIIAAVIRDGKSEQWRRDGGKFIPHPATWLNGSRWDDEPAGASSASQKRIYRLHHLGFVEVHSDIGGISSWSATGFKTIEEYENAHRDAA